MIIKYAHIVKWILLPLLVFLLGDRIYSFYENDKLMPTQFFIIILTLISLSVERKNVGVHFYRILIGFAATLESPIPLLVVIAPLIAYFTDWGRVLFNKAMASQYVVGLKVLLDKDLIKI